jgi:hypothetical protein
MLRILAIPLRAFRMLGKRLVVNTGVSAVDSRPKAGSAVLSIKVEGQP